MIDTGLGVRSLREAALDLFERPVTAVLTHAHFDHQGGAHEFGERLGHASELEEHGAPGGFYGLTAEALGDDVVRSSRRAGYDLPRDSGGTCVADTRGGRGVW